MIMIMTIDDDEVVKITLITIHHCDYENKKKVQGRVWLAPDDDDDDYH